MPMDCTNPSRRWLGEMVGKSVKNSNEIRAYIKTHALLGRGSKYIYADICAVDVNYEMSFPHFADRLGNLVQV